MWREIVTIDEDKCDGCGLCVPACQEGALRIVDGKARLASDRLCDGLGACLGQCPRGAIRIERREAVPFDEDAVQAHRQGSADGCPGSRFARFDSGVGVFGTALGSGEDVGPGQPSALTHWPVQLRLLSPAAPVLSGARLLVAADCVPVAYADFHGELLRGRAVVIACPKLDDPRSYVEKLAEMIRLNDLAEITVAHMEVPCCTGLLRMVLEARRQAEGNVDVEEVVIGVRGQVLARRRFPPEVPISKSA